MKMKRLPKSLRKYIRTEKARIRREILDFKKQEESINELYQRYFKAEREKKEKEKAKTG